MKILAVCSVINFRDFTRRATLEAIKKKVDRLDVLLYTSLKNRFRKKIYVRGIKFSIYHFWVPDKYKKYSFISAFEHSLRYRYWKRKISEYDLIFFTDPNQAWLIPYIQSNKIIYLLRDPNILQENSNKDSEKLILQRADLVLATSKNLASVYIQKYYNIKSINVHYWPNCVDLKIWDHKKHFKRKHLFSQTIGVAGNFNTKRTDYDLIDYITDELPELTFEIAGSVDYKQSKAFCDKLFSKKNVHYLGHIPLDLLPATVAEWDAGLITDKMVEYSSYMHHNKVYQYLSLGIPVVSLKIHSDYDHLFPYVQTAVDKPDYKKTLKHILDKSNDKVFRNLCIEQAVLNSSEHRAQEFISFINTI